MTPTPPRTVRAVDTAQLLDLAQEASLHGFSQRLPVDWLQEHLAAEATHYLYPTGRVAGDHHWSPAPSEPDVQR